MEIGRLLIDCLKMNEYIVQSQQTILKVVYLIK